MPSRRAVRNRSRCGSGGDPASATTAGRRRSGRRHQPRPTVRVESTTTAATSPAHSTSPSRSGATSRCRSESRNWRRPSPRWRLGSIASNSSPAPPASTSRRSVRRAGGLSSRIRLISMESTARRCCAAVTAAVALDHEPSPLVQPPCRGVVRPHLEVDLVGPGPAAARRSRRRLRAEAVASVVRQQRYAELAASPFDIDVGEPDQAGALDGDQGPGLISQLFHPPHAAEPCGRQESALRCRSSDPRRRQPSNTAT